VANNAPNSPVSGVRTEGRALVVNLTGDIDLHRSAELQQSLLALVDKAPRAIVLDLSGVPYMDSSGVASLVKLLTRVRAKDIDLKLCGLTARVRSMFEITRLDSVFSIHPSVAEALA
jgi:anti-sigma B factor antagonist